MLVLETYVSLVIIINIIIVCDLTAALVVLSLTCHLYSIYSYRGQDQHGEVLYAGRVGQTTQHIRGGSRSSINP